MQHLTSTATRFIHRILSSTGIGVYISRIEEASSAERAGLRPGDTILEVNGTPFSGMTHDEALTVNEMSFASLTKCACGMSQETYTTQVNREAQKIDFPRIHFRRKLFQVDLCQQATLKFSLPDKLRALSAALSL